MALCARAFAHAFRFEHRLNATVNCISGISAEWLPLDPFTRVPEKAIHLN